MSGEEMLNRLRALRLAISKPRTMTGLRRTHRQREAIRSAAAKADELSADKVQAGFDRILLLLPFLHRNLEYMRHDLQVALAVDVDRVVERVISLRESLPDVDVEKFVLQRPAFLLELEADKWPACLDALRKRFNEEEMFRLIEEEPLLLVISIDEMVQEMLGMLPGKLPAVTESEFYDALRREPSLISEFMESKSLNQAMSELEVEIESQKFLAEMFGDGEDDEDDDEEDEDLE